MASYFKLDTRCTVDDYRVQELVMVLLDAEQLVDLKDPAADGLTFVQVRAAYYKLKELLKECEPILAALIARQNSDLNHG